MLFRITYVTKDGFARGITFSAKSIESAADFARHWEATVGVPVLMLKKLPESPWNPKVKTQLELV